MTFVEYMPREFVTNRGLADGEVSLDKNGTATFRAEDLALVGIDGVAVVLVDELTMRVAVRAARPSDGKRALLVKPVKRHNGKLTGSRRIYLGGALRSIRIDPGAVRGRYELTTKDNLIIINLVDATNGDDAKVVDA